MSNQRKDTTSCTYVVVWHRNDDSIVRTSYDTPREAAAAEIKCRKSGIWAWIEIEITK